MKILHPNDRVIEQNRESLPNPRFAKLVPKRGKIFETLPVVSKRETFDKA